ncbi:MAG TPA: hypothetical protein VIR15_04295 [Intrasporangium sp.]|uniref:hypothetical protein n=1 Tax=Intrasporangium sp. TaxID=1925024 RepID=UPI002F9389EB
MKIRMTPKVMLKGRRVPERGTGLEGGDPVPAVCSEALDQRLDMPRTDEQVRVGTRLAIASKGRVDGNPLDVQDFHPCLISKDLQSCVRHGHTHADRQHDLGQRRPRTKRTRMRAAAGSTLARPSSVDGAIERNQPQWRWAA